MTLDTKVTRFKWVRIGSVTLSAKVMRARVGMEARISGTS
jgi:hypothetical protein